MTKEKGRNEGMKCWLMKKARTKEQCRSGGGSARKRKN
jgi:hypothetical protein